MTFTGFAGTSSAYLQLSATLATFGAPSQSSSSANGTGRWKQDFGTNKTTVTVLGTATNSTDSGLEPLRFLMNHASNVVNVLGSARVGIATTYPTETSTLRDLNLTSSGAVVTCGAGVTLTNLSIADGDCTINGTVTDTDLSGGDLKTNPGSYTLTTLSVSDATATLLHRKASTTVTVARVGQTATATATAHGFSNGDIIKISGANQAEYNETWIISNVAANTFDFIVNGSPATTATGTIFATPVSVTTLNTYDGAVIDVSGIITDFVVGTWNIYGDCTIRISEASHNHFGVGMKNHVRGNITWELV